MSESECCASNCFSHRGSGHLMFPFPEDPTIRKAWKRNCGKGKRRSLRSQLLCELHFEKDQWLEFRRTLKASAVPTVFSDRLDLSHKILSVCDKNKSLRANDSFCRKSWDMYQDIWRVSNDCDVCGLHKYCEGEVHGRASADSDESEMARLREHNHVLKSHIAFLSKQLMEA